MTLFGHKVIAVVIKLGGVHIGVGGPLIQYNWCPSGKGETWGQMHTKRMTCENEGRD